MGNANILLSESGYPEFKKSARRKRPKVLPKSWKCSDSETSNLNLQKSPNTCMI